MKPGSRDSELQQLWGRWMFLSPHQVSVMLNSRVGQHLSKRPFSALAVVLFVAMAALPVGLFLTFALVTVTMSVVGVVFFEGRWTQRKLHCQANSHTRNLCGKLIELRKSQSDKKTATELVSNKYKKT
uniref:Uncharacterized protein n=1 Tax=Amphiprion ocellaris TaxID=80972 RepID=A0AAQ5XKM3_AMPOC